MTDKIVMPLFKKANVTDLMNTVRIPCFNDADDCTFWFELEKEDEDEEWFLSDVVQAACSAPSFYESFPIDTGEAE